MSAQEYEWTDDAGLVRLRATPSPPIQTSAPLDLEGTDPAAVVLTVKGAAAQTADILDATENTGSFGMFISSDGSVTLAAPNGGAIGLGNTTTLLIVDGSTNGLGFFGAAPVAQPAAPTTLADVIAALKTLGLVAT